MGTRVYANHNEICCKAARGSSMLLPSDVCWSPPAPPAGPLPLPYPNSAMASTLNNGSGTVFICRSEIALKDASYFATSVGNEPATMAFQRGIATQVIKGKAVFINWSPNVKVEALSVCRHLDPMTHNHR
ncbi:PAAR-like domain-containing protein [Chitinimonas lacunae]|uniref:PAAR-like domain-containing protein n=1 Tax=Chitinimonas lacunae TaxID=1963018 RepID=A0ABV8MUK0_9NEIS